MRKIALKYGFWMLIGFTAFFLLMYLFGLYENYNLRVFNGFIHLGLIYLAIREYRATYEQSINNYLSGVAMGIYTSTLGVVGFSIFMTFFLFASPEFMLTIQESMPIGKYLNPMTTSLFLLVEGTAISLIGSYILTRVIDMGLAKA